MQWLRDTLLLSPGSACPPCHQYVPHVCGGHVRAHCEMSQVTLGLLGPKPCVGRSSLWGAPAMPLLDGTLAALLGGAEAGCVWSGMQTRYRQTRQDVGGSGRTAGGRQLKTRELWARVGKVAVSY